MLLAVVAPLLLLLLVCQPGTGLCVLLAVVAPLLLSLLVCQPGTGLYVLLAVVAPLLLPLLVCQPGTHHLFLKCTFEGNVYLHTHISLPLELRVVFLLHKLQLHRN
jgi:hypothetical protein